MGLKGILHPTGGEGKESSATLQPSLDTEHEMPLGKKTHSVQYLKAIRREAPGALARVGIRFC